MEDRKFLFISLVVSFVLIMGAVLFLSKGGGGGTGKIVDSTILVKDGSHVKGVEGAKVTIVEFSDFQCPACKTAQGELDKVETSYKDKIRIVYRQYPLTTVHKYAEKAAEAGEHASDNGKFWEWHDIMFVKQDEWSRAPDGQKLEEYFSGYAKSLGLDDKKMIEVLNNKTYAARVQSDVDDGNRAGINATPTFFVNGEETSGYGFDEFKRLIEKNLK